MRITIKDLNLTIENLNRYLKQKNYNVIIGHRYNYYTLDLYDLNNKEIDVLNTGLTKKECYTILWAMIKAIELIS